MTADATNNSIDNEISKRYFKEYDSLTKRQQRRTGSQEEHDARREALGLTGVNAQPNSKPRMAGEALRQLKSGEERNQTGIDNARDTVYSGGLETFDPTAAGLGSKQGKAVLSRGDIRGLREAGVSRKDIVQYADDNSDVDSSSPRAQKLLNKYRNRIANNAADTTPDTDTQDPVDTDPVDTTNPDNTGGEPPNNDTPNPPEQTASAGTPPIVDSRYWHGDQHTAQVLKNLDQYLDRGREGFDHYSNRADLTTQIYKDRVVGDPMQMLGDASTMLLGSAQAARDRALIQQTKLFGDMDNYKPDPIDTTPYNQPPESDLGDITDDITDQINNM